MTADAKTTDAAAGRWVGGCDTKAVMGAPPPKVRAQPASGSLSPTSDWILMVLSVDTCLCGLMLCISNVEADRQVWPSREELLTGEREPHSQGKGSSKAGAGQGQRSSPELPRSRALLGSEGGTGSTSTEHRGLAQGKTVHFSAGAVSCFSFLPNRGTRGSKGRKVSKIPDPTLSVI